MKKVIQDLKNNKSTGGEVPVSILKECEFTFKFLKNCINKSIHNKSNHLWDYTEAFLDNVLCIVL